MKSYFEDVPDCSSAHRRPIIAAILQYVPKVSFVPVNTRGTLDNGSRCSHCSTSWCKRVTCSCRSKTAAAGIGFDPADRDAAIHSRQRRFSAATTCNITIWLHCCHACGQQQYRLPPAAASSCTSATQLQLSSLQCGSAILSSQPVPSFGQPHFGSLPQLSVDLRRDLTKTAQSGSEGTSQSSRATTTPAAIAIVNGPVDFQESKYANTIVYVYTIVDIGQHICIHSAGTSCTIPLDHAQHGHVSL